MLFEHGPCVILVQARGDLKAQAIALLAEWGPIHVGTPAGDFNVVELGNYEGWVVTCQHPDILTYVAHDETDSTSDMLIGLLGRSKRAQDAAELNVMHVAEARE